MSIGTVYFGPNSGSGKTIKAVAAIAGLTFDTPTDYVHFESNLKPEFLAKFPHGKIPAFEAKDGFTLFESTAIIRYFAGLAPNANLLGGDPKSAALVDQWIHFAETEITQATGLISSITSNPKTPYNKALHATLVERQARAFDTLEKVLATRTFLVGERLTLADLVVAQAISWAVSVTLDAEARKSKVNVIRHLETVANQPKVAEVYAGTINYADKAAQYTPPAKEKKEAAPAAAKAPKAPKAKAAAAENDEDDEPSAPEEPKAKNPLELLPKPAMAFDDWKRAYSNKDTRGTDGAIEWLYQNFDTTGYSIWRVDFKYNEELTLVFMSSNQISGFFNRLEASRKFLFGSMGVLGEKDASIISGIFIARGDDIKLAVDCAPDWESYAYTKLDIANEADKKFLEGSLAWDLEIDGKKWADGKVFK